MRAPHVNVQNDGINTIRQLLAPTASLVETVTATSVCWEGNVFRAERLDVLQPNGTCGIRDIARHSGGAGVLAVRDDGRMCVVRQWRVALNRMTLEIPAGKVEAHEDARSAAARELAEETGLVAERFTLIAKAAGSPGFTNETTSIYRAHKLSMREAHPEPSEFVEVFWLDPADIVCAASIGLIQDAKTIIAAYAQLLSPRAS